MKIKIDSIKLLKALNNIQLIVERRTTRNILSNVRIDTKNNKISFLTTDLDIFAKESINVNVTSEICTTVPISTLYEILKKIHVQRDIEMIFEPSNKPLKMFMNIGLSKFSLPCLPADEFPDFKEDKYNCEFQISSNDLRYLIATTKHAVGCDEARYYLNGIFLHIANNNGVNVLRAVATDIHRLAICNVTLPKNAQTLPDVIVPRKAIIELLKLLENFNEQIKIGVSSEKIMFQVGNTNVTSKLINGKFPEYIKVIPYSNNKILKISTFELIKAINLVTSISTEKIVTIKLQLKKDRVILSVNNRIHSSGIVEVPAIYSDEEITIAFNSRYVIDVLNNLKGHVAYFKFDSTNTAVLVADSINTTNCNFVLMPIQV